MANKRVLKQNINVICEELFAECLAKTLYGSDADSKNCEALAYSILKLQSEFISRISHPEPGMPAKKYYKSLIADFNNSVNEVVDHIKNLHA